MARHNEIGKMGEDLAAKWLISKGFHIVERNYLRKWGEIDIVARETLKRMVFVEVKTVSYETKDALAWAVTHETWRPEDKIHANKQMRLKRAIQTWISDHAYDGECQIDILTVRMVPREKFAQINRLENVIFE
jgi:putative endonuclease